MSSLVQNGVEKMANGQDNDVFTLSETLQFAKKLMIHGGNIANWNRTKRKTTSSSSDELCENITTTLKCCLPVTNNNNLKNKEHSKTIRSVNNCFVEKIKKDERVHLKISVKIFALNPSPSLVRDSLFRENDRLDYFIFQEAMCELGVDSIETLLISIPESQDKPDASFEGLKMLWEEMEELFDSGYASALGTCDLDKEMLEKLYNWARIKPEINQVNLASCCVMPKDLVAYSKEYDIQLLTHADPKGTITASVGEGAGGFMISPPQISYH
ncbi:hypothetical protein QZH41_016330 [Actinostola sp. cb2023]|nr:hypothetical protein QZH41_016330 [Actinostola sp. cb2023]